MSIGRALYGRFLVSTAVIAIAMPLIGYVPTRRLGGDEAIPAMLVGCLVALLASLAGTVPVLLARDRSPVDAVPAMMIAMGVRLGVAVVLGFAVAASGLVPAKPLLYWVVIAHAGLMIPDTHFSIKVLAQRAMAEDR